MKTGTERYAEVERMARQDARFVLASGYGDYTKSIIRLRAMKDAVDRCCDPKMHAEVMTHYRVFSEKALHLQDEVNIDTYHIGLGILHKPIQSEKVPFEWLERWYVLLIFGIVALAIFVDSLIGGFLQ